MKEKEEEEEEEGKKAEKVEGEGKEREERCWPRKIKKIQTHAHMYVDETPEKQIKER